MRCPFCAHDDTQVKDSRPTEDSTAIRRRRQCEGCGARFTTFERVQLRDVLVVKATGRKEPFDRTKVERAVALACRKRNIEPERIDQLVSGIQRQVETAGEAEISSSDIGAMAMEGLSRLDPVAYIRFASVYRDFSDARDFEEFASAVQQAGNPDTALNDDTLNKDTGTAPGAAPHTTNAGDD